MVSGLSDWLFFFFETSSQSSVVEYWPMMIVCRSIGASLVLRQSWIQRKTKHNVSKVKKNKVFVYKPAVFPNHFQLFSFCLLPSKRPSCPSWGPRKKAVRLGPSGSSNKRVGQEKRTVSVHISGKHLQLLLLMSLRTHKVVADVGAGVQVVYDSVQRNLFFTDVAQVKSTNCPGTEAQSQQGRAWKEYKYGKMALTWESPL